MRPWLPVRRTARAAAGSGACACVRCGDDVCADSETATSCPADCTRSYRACSFDQDCDFGLYCGAGGICTDSCFRTCDLDPGFDESCSSTGGIGFCIAHCRLDSASSTHVCPADRVCSNPIGGGDCVAPGR